MPIEDRFKFWCTEGAVKPGGPSDWAICNVDQRRIITVRMDEDQDSEDVALNYFKKHAESLGPDVTQIHLAPNGDVVSLSTDPMLDTTLTIYYPSLDLIKAPKGVHVQTVLRSDLRELDRFCSNVDLVSYQTTDTTPPTTKKAVFKYYWQEQFMEQRWDELNLWLRLPSHPNIVPLDRVVLDEVRGGVVGFTTPYISGGNLEDNASRPFKLKWARQLMQVVDDLNLRYGIAHQDVVPRNLLVDEETDNIMLYDFNVSAQIGRFRGPGFLFYWDVRDDVRAVIFTIYELITRDFHFRQEDWRKLDVALVQDVEWVPHPDVTLDHPVSEYRTLLNAWVKGREQGKQVTMYTEAPDYIDWPVLEEPELGDRAAQGYWTRSKVWSTEPRWRAKARGEMTTDWMRPSQRTLQGDYHLLASGKLLDPVE